MILLFAAMALADPPKTADPSPPLSPTMARFEACVALASANPAKALDEAGAWRIDGGGVLARQCSGLAYAAMNRWPSAALAFEQAAKQSESDRDGRAPRLWVLAGNAALAGREPGRARGYFDAALSGGALKGGEAGEAHLDRARARVAGGDYKGARADLDAALKLVPADPLGWLLSATLARKEGDLKRAQADILEATKRSPDDASVANEAGNIAIMLGEDDAARQSWEEAVRLNATSDAGKAAAAALKQLGERAAEAPKSGDAPAPKPR
jgi:tetratricopeptide (TPR) repeat protein